VTKRKRQFDEIGNWSEIKLDIVRKYAAAYSTILAKQKRLVHYYIDGFAGAGVHISKTTNQLVPGSALNALSVEPRFKRYFLIDLDGGRIASLRRIIGERTDIELHEGDCNDVLIKKIFPQVRHEQYRRALCLLDPYGLDLDWKVIATAGQLRTIDLLLNFPIMDANRNALWTRPELVKPSRAAPLTTFWGDESWRDAAYHRSSQESLFGDVEVEKQPNDAVVEAFRKRLRDVAGFKNVPQPIPMRNRSNAVIYYLFFASQNDAASRIASDIFRRYAQGKAT
jgi:three-Cys-motif partner protein